MKESKWRVASLAREVVDRGVKRCRPGLRSRLGQCGEARGRKAKGDFLPNRPNSHGLDVADHPAGLIIHAIKVIHGDEAANTVIDVVGVECPTPGSVAQPLALNDEGPDGMVGIWIRVVVKAPLKVGALILPGCTFRIVRTRLVLRLEDRPQVPSVLA
jgi:hypothetical protein